MKRILTELLAGPLLTYEATSVSSSPSENHHRGLQHQQQQQHQEAQTMAETPWEQKRAYLFSHPRTTTNLLLRMLSGQSEWNLDGYFFYDAFIYAREKIAASSLDDVPQAAWGHYKSLREDALQRTHSILEEARTKVRDTRATTCES